MGKNKAHNYKGQRKETKTKTFLLWLANWKLVSPTGEQTQNTQLTQLTHKNRGNVFI